MTAIPPRARMPVPEALARPNVVAPQPYSLPTPTRFRLSNGAKGLAYDLPGQYVLSVRMAIPMPLRVEPREVEGVATIMARTLDEGTARHTSVAFARLLERRGVAIGCGVGDSGLSVELDVAKHNLAYGLDLLRQCLAEPAFPEDEVARQIATRLAEIEQERSVASHRAAAEFAATFFDPDARAARPVGGTADTVAAISREAVVAFHARHVAPAEATVVVAGDLAGLDVVSEVEATLGQWQTPAGYLSPGPGNPRCSPRIAPGSSSSTGPARCRPSSWSVRRGRTVTIRRAGLPTRCWASSSVAHRPRGSIRCCGRTRAIRMAFAQPSDPADAGASSSRQAACALRSVPTR